MIVIKELKREGDVFVVAESSAFPATVYGPFVNQTAAEDVLRGIGATKGEFPLTLDPEDHPFDEEGWILGEMSEGEVLNPAVSFTPDDVYPARAFIIEDIKLVDPSELK